MYNFKKVSKCCNNTPHATSTSCPTLSNEITNRAHYSFSLHIRSLTT